MKIENVLLDLKFKSTPQLRDFLEEHNLGYNINREKRTCEIYFPLEMKTRFYNIELHSNYICLVEVTK